MDKLTVMQQRLSGEKKRGEIGTVKVKVISENFEKDRPASVDPGKFTAYARKGEIGVLLQIIERIKLVNAGNGIDSISNAVVQFGDDIGAFDINDVVIHAPLTMYSKVCAQCEKTLITTSKLQKVHDECRIQWHQKKAAGRQRVKGYELHSSQIKLARTRIIIGEPCAACGYTGGVKIRKIKIDGELKPTYLCLNCLNEIRTGQMELITWKKLILGGSNPENQP